MKLSLISIAIAVSLIILMMFVTKRLFQATFDGDNNWYLVGGSVFIAVAYFIMIPTVSSLENTILGETFVGITLSTLFMGAYLLKSWLTERGKKK